MRTLPLPSVQSTAKSTGRLYRRLFRKAFLIRLIRGADLSALSPEEVARDFSCTDEKSIERLLAALRRTCERLRQKGKLSDDRCQALIEWQQNISPATLGELLSPYHSLLSEKPFYHLSDAPTRRRLRKSAARFAAWHRLSPESAALLWKGELPRPHYLLTALPLLAIPAAAVSGGVLLSLLPLAQRLPALLILPALFGGFYLLAVALLQKLLPSSPLPLLRSGEGHSLLVVGIGSAEQPQTALEGMARMISAGYSDCRYQLVLIPSDGSAREAAGEEASAASIRAEAEKLASRFDCTLEVTFAKRQYEPSRKQWKGTPTFPQLAKLLWESISAMEEDTVPEAICLLPVEAAIFPDTFERLSAALFHPLCPADSLVFLRSPFSPHPTMRLQTLRSCLLQKLNAPADFHGYGILRKEALQAVAACDAGTPYPLSPRLSGETLSLVGEERERRSSLFSHCQSKPFSPPLRQTPSLLPWLPIELAILRPLLLLWMIVANTPPLLFVLLALLSSADLWASALLSFSPSPKRFCLSTLSAWKVLGKEQLTRLLLPLRELWELHPIGGRVGFCLASLFFGSAVIVTEFLPLQTPLFFLGLIWGIAPLLIGEPSHRQTLTANQKAACYALAEEIYPMLLEEEKLPPAYKTLSGEAAPYTTPTTLGSELIALLSALDLGLCDAHTAEQKIAARLTKLESLPTRCGLPFARYAIETEDFYKDSTVSSAECGLYALCLAALEGGLRAYRSSHPSLSALADRAARLSDRMDLSLLLTDEDRLCRTLSPSGEQVGELPYLCGMGGVTLFAVLASDSTLSMGSQRKKRAFSELCAPITLKKGHLLIRSEQGELWEYLLPSLLLPLPEESLLAVGGRCALKLCLREARHTARSERRSKLRSAAPNEARVSSDALSPSQRTHGFRRLLFWSHLGKSAPLPQTGSRLLGRSADPMPLTAPLLCLLLEQKPRIALCGLQKLQQSAPMGGFTDPAFGDRIPYTGLSFSLIALAGAVTSRSFRERIKALPRCGVLLPLLDRRWEEWREESPPHFTKAEELPTHTPPSLFLLGDANHGLLLRQGGLLSLWEGGKPLTAPQASDPLLSPNRITALLFSDGNRLLPFPCRPERRTPYRLCLEGEEISCEILQEAGGWCLQLTRAQASPVELRFLLSPAFRKGKPIRLTTHRDTLPNIEPTEEHPSVASPSDPSIALVLELSPSQTLAIGLRGVDFPFTHADPSPFPTGERQLLSLFSLPPKEASGFCETPSCMIGGTWRGRTLSLRLCTASQKRDAIERLRFPATIAADTKGTPFPLPVPDRSLAAMAMEWELNALYYGQAVPTATAIGSTHLARCLDSARQILAEKGFSLASTLPTPLTVSHREGAEALLSRLLGKAPLCAQTPLLPPSGEITAPEGFWQILRGRDLPSLCRIYHNGIATLWADPEDFRFSPTLASEPIPLRLLLAHREAQQLLPASATALSYEAGQAVFSGDGFTLTASLLPNLPLLTIRLTSTDDAELVLPTLSLPHKEEGSDRFWYLSETQVLYFRTWKETDTQTWLIGTFPRAHDHLYYWIKENVTAQTLPAIMDGYNAEQRIAATVLTGISPNLPAFPALAAAVLEGTDRSRALLAPICTPASAKAALLQLSADDRSLLLPTALLLYHAVLGEERIDDCLIPIAGGRESLYLHAARSLEYAMENAPENPLLPTLTAAFAKLASEHCDSAAPLYAAFEPPADACYPADGIDPLWHCPRKTVLLLAKLYQSDPCDSPAVVSALLNTIEKLPPNPPAAEAALLWCGVLFGVLGFHPAENGCTLAPLAVKEAYQFRLSYRGEHIVQLFPDAPPHTVSAESVQSEKKGENISPQPIFSRQNG